MKKSVKNIYEFLQKKRGKIKRRTFLLAGFFLAVNIFAWFVYITQVDVNIDAKVISWDVNFFDGPTAVKEINISEKIYPGMPVFTKTINVTNASETKAQFEYLINKFTVLGEDTLIDGGTNEEQIFSIENDYPFVIEFDINKEKLEENDTLSFTITIHWDYENIGEYQKLTKHFIFDPSVTYYVLEDGDFIPFSATQSNFERNKLDLYLQKDDADSFFGEACGDYEKDTGLSCLNINLTLRVSQDNS